MWGANAAYPTGGYATPCCAPIQGGGSCGFNSGFALIVVLFILLIIVGAAFCC
ncbi:MAG: YjcZ family sporulation protein [Bacilli bacterium]